MNSPLKIQTIIFFICFVLSGIILWMAPYNEASLLEFSFFWKWLVVVAVIAAITAQRTNLSFPDCVSATAFGPAAADLVRIIVETAADSSKHNLWPFELIVSLCVGGIGALVGAGFVFAVRKLRKREPTET